MNGVYLPASSNGFACDCDITRKFVWNTGSLSCVCVFGYYLKDGGCVQCLNNAATPSLSTVPNKCDCNATAAFVWSDTIYRCICTNLFFLDFSGKCTACRTLVGATDISTSVMERCDCNTTNNFEWKDDLKKCVCIDTYYLVSNTTGCRACSSLPGTLDTPTTNNVCNCDIDNFFEWSSTEKKCVCQLGKYYSLVEAACKDCASLLGALTPSKTAGVCVCNTSKNFVWSPTASKCVCANLYYLSSASTCLLCQGRPQTVSSGASVDGKCVCLTGYTWSEATYACVCADTFYLSKTGTCLSCKTLAGTVALGTTLNFECVCDSTKNFRWDSVSKTCICSIGFYFKDTTKTCIDCTTVVGNAVNPADNGKTCTCLANLTWSPTLYACRCATIGFFPNAEGKCTKCSTLLYGLATGALSNGVACTCNTAGMFVWKPATFSCECGSKYYLSAAKTCLLCSGSGNLGTSTDNVCNCNAGSNFEWKTPNLRCLCKDGFYLKDSSTCASCSTVLGYNDEVSSDGTTCPCNSGSTWNTTAKACACTLGNYVA